MNNNLQPGSAPVDHSTSEFVQGTCDGLNGKSENRQIAQLCSENDVPTFPQKTTLLTRTFDYIRIYQGESQTPSLLVPSLDEKAEGLEKSLQPVSVKFIMLQKRLTI